MLRPSRIVGLTLVALLSVSDLHGGVARGAGGVSSCFSGAVTFPTAPNPFSVAIADFNEDGNPDLAAAAAGANAVSVLAGDGSGGFGPALSFGVGSMPSAIVSADFNRDGHADLAVANGNAPATGTDDLSVLLGTGTGSFFPAQNFGIGQPVQVRASSIAAADFNRDGRLDLAVGTYSLNSVSILLGNGAGAFSHMGTYGPTFQNLFSIAVGDFNRDGSPDVVATADFVHSVAVFLGTASGALGAPTLFPAGPLAISVDVGDLNADGIEDLAVGDQGGFVSVLIGNGLGGFGPFTSFPTGFSTRGVVLADFNGDGNLDAAAANSGSNNVSVLLGNGLGGFGPATNYAVGSAPIGLEAGDLDRDGLPDLAVGNSSSNSVSVLINGAPTVIPQTLPAGVVNTPYPATQFSASGGVPPDSFTLVGAPPEGLVFAPATATLSGVPTQAGTTSFSITVTDASGCSSTRNYSVFIDRAPTVVVVTSSPNPSFVGQTVRLTATVFGSPSDPTTPTGTVEFRAGPTIGTAPLADGVATVDISTLSAGTHFITALYAGDANFFPNTVSSVVPQVVLIVPEVPTLHGLGFAAFALALAAAGLFVMRARG